MTRPQWPEISRLPLTINERTDGPQGAFPPSPPKDEPRTVSAALSLGPGWLALRDAVGRDGQPALGFAGRLGFVVAPEWNLVLGADRTRAQRGGATFSQTAGLLGLQRFFLGRIYFGGALGLAWVKESGVPDSLSDGPGYAFSGSIGLEVVKTSHAALTTEVTVTIAQYSREKWEMGGIRLGFVVF